MSYFLRHFVHGTGAPLGESTSAASDDLSSTLLGLSFADFDHKQSIEAAANRERYSELLMRCAKTTFKNGMLGNANFVEKNSKIDSSLECTSEATKYVEVVAAPSLQGANFLALTTALRSIVQNHSQKTSSTAIETALDGPLVCPANAAQPHSKSHQLVAVSLDSIFSILLELNQRDADLCAQALQQLLQLLQAVPPEGFINEPKPTVIKMYDMLRKLRSEGNSNVSATANACMVSLAIARGEPDLIFAAVQSLLCDAKEKIAFNMVNTECSELPKNFQSMAVAVQRSVQNTGTNSQGTFWSMPLTEHAEIASFELTFPAGNLVSSDLSETTPDKVMSCLVSDGTYVYVLTTLGLFKVGTGLTESLCGKVAAFNDLLKFTEGSALFVCQESLYLRRRHSTRLWVIDRETLREIGEIMLHASLTEGVLFSDGRNFYQGTLDAQWNFMITPLDDSFGAISSQKHKQFNRLVELNYVVFGNSFTNCQDRLLNAIPQQLQMIAIDFQFTDDTGFILTRTGEVFYAGRASSFNLSDTGTTWTELTLTEPIVQMHLDCNINCRLFLRSGSGHLWFVGSLSGLMDQQINHGMSHSKKLRKIRIPHRKRCTYISGISGAMSYVTDNGKCYLFGRHIMTTNNDNGQLTGFDGFSVASIGIGKTHVVAISKSGLVYTCGLNNLNQCGRDEPLNKPLPIPTARQQSQTEDSFRFVRQGSPRGRNSASPRIYCFPNEHLFIKDTASICMRCGQCSGRNNDSCPTREISGGIKRITLNRGMTCVCDATDSVCLRCGICATCAESDNLNVDREEEDIGSRQPEAAASSIPKAPMIFPQGTQLSPARLVLQGDIKVSTLSCGNYHTILLCADRSVYTFGSNCHGQLGTGDTLKRSGAYKLNLPSNIQVVQAVAGANHCVLRTLDGQVITFGAYKQGQLGRNPDPKNTKWFATPTAIPGYGQAHGMIVSWVSAEGDQTILQTQKQTFSKAVLNDATITANKDCLAILAHADNTCEDYVIIKRNSSEVSRFKIDFERFGRMSFSLDPYYNLLWTFDDETFKVTAFSDAPDGSSDLDFPIANVESLASTLVSSSVFAEPALLKQHRQLLQCPELCVPESNEPEFSDPQMAIFLLTTIYSITVLAATGQLESPAELVPTPNQKRNSKFLKKKPLKKLTATEVNLDHENGGFCAVNRFDSFGGGWGYSAHCVEAIQFKVNKPIRLCGIGLFGGRGEYSAKLKLLKVVGGGDLDEQCVELLAESNETIYECAPKETVVLQFDKNVTIKPDEWHVIWAQIHGPSSDCGASGKPMMNGTGNVEFTFRNSILSNNGTDVDVGQIPEIYYTLVTSKNDFDEKSRETSDRTPGTESDSESVLPLISAKTLFSITPGTISSLFDIFSWAMKGAFSTREYNVIVDDELLWKQERYAFVAVISLRMLRLYIALLAASNEAFQKVEDTSEEAAKQNFDEFANVVIDFSSILKNVFTIADEKSNPKDRIGGLVVEEAIDAYVACADLLLPSTELLRSRISQSIAQGYRNWSLLALLKACHKLEGQALAVLIPDRDGSASTNDNQKRTLSQTFSKYFMPTKNTAAEELSGSAIIRFLFELAFASKESSTNDPLISRLRTAAQSLITVFAKCLVAACLHDEVEPPLVATDNRFRKFNNHLNWETGNGAHDGIAFRTDSAGITIYGIGIFVGAPLGADFSYELETFVNTGDMANECWSLIEQQNGSIKDTPGMNITQQEGPTAAVNQKLLTFVKLMKPISLKPDVIYAVRIHLSAGKTFYGDNGQTCVRLANGGRINFLPCSLSRNGTNIIRGQIPHLVYAVEEPKKKKSVVKSKSADKEGKFWLVDNEVHNVFLDIMRLLAQKLSYLIAMNEINTDEKLLSGQLVAYANVFLEANPNLGFHLVSAIDEVLPLLTAANADEVKHLEKVENDECDALKPKVTQAIVESPHPYKSAQIYSQTVLFNASVEFVSIRFHDECQTAQPDDCLWIYVGHCDSGCWYPIGRYYGDKHWPEAQLLLPGNKLWFVLETVQPGEDLNPGAMYGFRCTVDGYCSTPEISDGAQKPINAMLEHQFAWLVASACRLLVAAPSGTKAVKKLREHEESTQELIRKHGGLLKRGLNIDALPTIGDVIAKRFPGLVQTHERQFIDEFIKASADSLPGKLARIFSSEIPFVDLTLSTVEIEAGEVVVGKPVRLLLFQKDQFNRDARCTQLTAEVSIASADDVVTHDHVNDADVANQNNSFGSGESSLTGGMTTDDHHNWRIGHTVGKDAFQTLRQLQTRESFASVYLNKARYKAISMMPVFADYSFEELRLAFQNAPTTKESLKLSFDVASGFYAVDWRPRKTGRFRIDCTVDGFKLASTTFIEVADRRTPAPSPRLFLDVSERAISRSPDNDVVPAAPKVKKAFFNPLNCFSAVRIRVHPSLSAPTSGIIERGSTITWAEFLRNDDGTWLKLTDEAKMMFCNPIDQQNMGQDAWCLQYTRAFERVLLEIDESDINQSVAVAPKTPRRQLPPIPPKRKKQPDEEKNRMQLQLDEDADVLTVKRTSIALSSTASSNQSTSEALGPRLIDCCRSVFAAIVWHERLVGDLMTCANHLKSHPGIEQLLPDLQLNPALPPCFPPLITLYRSTVQAVLEIIEQHLILPSPPALHGIVPPRQMYSPGEELCELCSELHPKPITVHMRQKHPGCGGACGGHGYNSIGNYTTGWTGLCGDGGDANAVWYLLCTNCRTEYLNNAANNENTNDQKDPNDWNQLRQKAANKQSSAEHVLKQNSMFLLDLRPADQLSEQMTRVTPKRIQYKVNLHPQAQMGDLDTVTSATFDDNIVDSDVIDAQPSPMHAISHQSDPGTAYPEAHTHASDFFTLSASANLFRSNKPQTPANGNVNTPKRPVRLASLTGLNGLLRHPVLLFAVEIHDLPKILSAFRRSIARATKFAYAFRVWNWLLKLVTSEAVVVDVVWSYLAALGSYLPYNRWLDVDMHFATRLKLLPHPWRLCFLGGSEVSKAMVDEMQAFLGTVAVILQSNGVDLGLKCLCFKAWTFQLTVHEQSLLLTLCNILSTVGAVLSDAGGDASSLFDESALSVLAGFSQQRSALPSNMPKKQPIRRFSSSHFGNSGNVVIKTHENVSIELKVVASSRPQMTHCLTDGNLDTFWESGDEDKARTRRLTLSWDDDAVRVEMLAIFVDNIRDANYKVRQLIIKNSKSTLINLDVDWNHVGWIKVSIPYADPVQIQIKGSEAGSRLRQIAIYGTPLTPEEAPPGSKTAARIALKSSNSHHLLFTTAQMDAFALFQAIAAQAFGDELAEEQNGTLRQQVIDMLFSRVQLQPLQSYVCFQMVSAVEREIISLRDRSKRNYSYVCGLMVMLVKICESRKGLEVFGLRNGLLVVLSELLLFAPEVVQMQVIATLGSLLRHFRPTALDCAQFLRNALASVAKSISLQIKDKVTRKINAHRMEEHAGDLPAHWKMDRVVSFDVALLIIDFVNQITSGNFGDHWSIAVRTELANTVMSLAQLLSIATSGSTNSLTPEPTASTSTSTDTARTAQSLRSAQFWLAVTALCLITDAKWLELSSAWRNLHARRSKEPDPLCENHDDGHTLAHFRCDICASNLCRECFTILHLNKKKKSHNARLIGSSTLCPKIDVHEGCTRLRLNNLLILFNTAKLSGMVEISADIGAAAHVAQSSSFGQFGGLHATAKCRFCATPLKTESESLAGVCSHADCAVMASDACDRILPCGHHCGGIKDETECLACFVCENAGSKQDGDDLCVICFTDRLGAAPCIQLECGHFFHFACVKLILEKRWPGPRILFRFMHCPLCKAAIAHPALNGLLEPLRALLQDVSDKAKLRLEYDGLLNHPAITSEASEFYNNPVGFALEKYVYVLCNKCGKAYFGGEASCQEALDSSTAFNPEELLCGGCSDVAGAEICGLHGAEYLEYKCRFCCSVAVYFCFASTHFCAGCHADFQRLMPLPKSQLAQCPVGPRCVQLEGEECPLRVQHPPTGEEFSLGCGVCRNIRTF